MARFKVPRTAGAFLYPDKDAVATLRGTDSGTGLRTPFEVHYLDQIPVSPQ